jgi:hypothetical protein
MAVMEAAKLAQAGGSTGMGGTLLGAAKNLGGAALGDFGGKLSGNLSHQHGNMGARMASRMKEERLSMAPPSESSKTTTDATKSSDGQSNPGGAANTPEQDQD